MDNKQVTAEWIAQQRDNLRNALGTFCAQREIAIIFADYDAALDALEAAQKYAEYLAEMAYDAGFDAACAMAQKEFSRLTAERDAAVSDMFGCMSTQGQCVRCKKRYYCDGTDDDKFSPLCKNNSHCYAWEWRGLHADNTDAPTGDAQEETTDADR